MKDTKNYSYTIFGAVFRFFATGEPFSWLFTGSTEVDTKVDAPACCPTGFAALRVRLAGVGVDGSAWVSPAVSVGIGSRLSGVELCLSGVVCDEELG